MTLVNCTLLAIPVHTAIAISISIPPWLYHAIDKIKRSFIWTGSENAHGGPCLVAWRKVARPRELGGLGVVDLVTMGYALRLRWEWLERADPSRTWVPTPHPRKEQFVQCLKCPFWFRSVMAGRLGSGKIVGSMAPSSSSLRQK
jgi:hypothetical protein